MKNQACRKNEKENRQKEKNSKDYENTNKKVEEDRLTQFINT